MAKTSLDIRQSVLRTALNMAGTAANASVDTILAPFDAELGKLFEDRNILLTDGGTITFTGTQLQFTENLKITLNQKISGAVPQVISLGSSNQNFASSGDMWVAVVDRTAGTATTSIVTNGNPLSAVSNANQEVFLLAKRVDAGDGTQRIYWRNGMAMNAGQSVRLGASGSGSGGSGIGDDLDALQYRASFMDLFPESANQSASSVDATAGHTNATYNAAKTMWTLSYDAAKTATTVYTFTVTAANATAGATYTNNGQTFTVTTTISGGTTLVTSGTGVPATSGTLTKVTGTGDATITFSAFTNNNITISATPAFTVAAGDVVWIQSTNEVRKITTVTSQTAYVLESAFSTNLSAGAVTISQAVHTKDIYNHAVDGVSIATAFSSSSFSDIMVTYKDNATSNSNLWTPNVAPFVGWVGSPDGTNYTSMQVRVTNETDQQNNTNLPSAGTSLYLRFFADRTSGSGIVNLLMYKAFMQKSVAAASGGVLNSAYAFTNGVGTPVGCTVGVTGGKTTITLTSFTYAVGYNSGLPYGSLDVYLNGQLIPRFINSTLTPDGSYTEVNANVIQLDRDYSSSNVSIEILQRVQIVDSSTTNTTQISALQEFVGDGFQGFINQGEFTINPTTTAGTPGPGSFYSSIIGRASMTDLSQSLKPQMGIERIMTQQIQQIQNEFGPNGEPVWGVVNDTFGQIRLVGGTWSAASGSPAGQYLIAGVNVTDYVEITFYGTGLNILTHFDGSNRVFVYNLDGGTDSSNFYPSGSASLLNNRGYSQNCVLNVVSNLSLGIHTIKIRNNTTAQLLFDGFEILNESSSVKVASGVGYISGKKYVTSALQSFAYNSVATGTRGGRVVVYQNADGTIGQAWQAVNASSAFTTSADHTNEEVIRSHFFREFGASRTTGNDDFSFGTFGGTARAFTLDDGTTTLVSSSASVQTCPTGLALEGVSICQTNGTFGYFTFVGTGLDLELFDGANGGSDSYTYQVDSSSTTAWPYTAGSTTRRVVKIASGLPYGTHVFKMNRVTAATFNIFITKFIVYGPKKPSIPSGTVELADYNVMANFSANSTASGATISTGTLVKTSAREFTYVDGTGGFTNWTVNLTNGINTGYGTYVQSNNLNAYVEYTFFGTGFESRWVSDPAISANNIQVSLQSLSTSGSLLSLTTGNFPTASFSTYGMSTGGFAAGVLSTRDATGVYGAGFITSNLPLGLYKVRFNNGSSGTSQFMQFQGLGYIAPIQSAKSNIYADLQNSLPVGSNSISDNRKTTPVKDALPAVKAWAQAVGVTSAPSTTSTTMIPMPDMSVTIKTNGGPLDIFFESVFDHNTTNGAAQWQIYVDGVAVTPLRDINLPTAGDELQGCSSIIVPVSAGTHKVDVFWDTNTGTLSLRAAQRLLKVREI